MLGRCDGILAILYFCFFVILVGVSAASIATILDNRNNVKLSHPCFGIVDQYAWRYLIGILAVSATGVLHSLVVVVLGFIPRAAGPFKWFMGVCLLPFAGTLLALGCIILADLYPTNGPIQIGGTYITGGPGGQWYLDNCLNVNTTGTIDRTAPEYPYKISYATGAIAIAFSGFMLLAIPLTSCLTCYGDNQLLIQRLTGPSTTAVITTNNGGYRSTRRDDYESPAYDESPGYSSY